MASAHDHVSSRLTIGMGERLAWDKKLEAVYSISVYGILFPSQDMSRCERFFANAPGVYLHKDAKHVKAEFYSRAVQLVPGGLFYSF